MWPTARYWPDTELFWLACSNFPLENTRFFWEIGVEVLFCELKDYNNISALLWTRIQNSSARWLYHFFPVKMQWLPVCPRLTTWTRLGYVVFSCQVRCPKLFSIPWKSHRAELLTVRWWCSGQCNITISRGPGFDTLVCSYAVHLLSFLRRSDSLRGITSPWRAIFGWATATKCRMAHSTAFVLAFVYIAMRYTFLRP